MSKKRRSSLEESSDDDDEKAEQPVKKVKTGKGKTKNLYTHPSIQKFIHKVQNPSFDDTQIDVNSRVLIVGGSGAGKTHKLTEYLLASKNTFHHVVLCNRGVEEPLYSLWKEKLEKKGQISFFTLDTLPDANVLSNAREDKDDQYLVVLDDIITDLGNKKLRSKIETYFTVGRKMGLTVVFLSQSYFQIPKTCRVNMTYLMLLKLSCDRDLKMVLADFGLGVTKDQLIDMYQIATEEKMDCLKIDIECTDPSKKFSRNFKDFFEIEGDVTLPDGTTGSVVTPGKWYNGPASRTISPPQCATKKGRGRSIFTNH